MRISLVVFVDGQVTEVLQADGVLDRIGSSQVYDEVYEAVADLSPDETEQG